MISLGIWIFLKQTYKIMILGKPTEEELSKVVLRDTEFKTVRRLANVARRMSWELQNSCVLVRLGC